MIVVADYAFLLLLFHGQQRSGTHHLLFRGACIAASYLLMAALIDYALNLVLMIISLFQGEHPTMMVIAFYLLLVTGVGVRIYFMRPEKVPTEEMENFIKVYLQFGNYLRRTDADTRAALEAHRIRQIYEEVHHEPLTDDKTAIAFETHGTTAKKKPVSMQKSDDPRLPPGFREDAASLRKGETVDVSQPFRFEIGKKGSDSDLSLIEDAIIDAEVKQLSLSIVFPMGRTVPASTPSERTRLVQQLYDMLQMLMAEEWFGMYAPFFTTIAAVVHRKEFSETLLETAYPILSMTVPLIELRRHSDTIVSVQTMERFAAIRFY